MTVTDFDPVAPDKFRGREFWGTETVATRLADAAAYAHDEYATAANACADVESEFNTEWHKALEKSDATSVAAREKDADLATYEKKSSLIRAQKAEKRAGKHIDVLLARMTVAMAHQKHMGRQDGGDW